jgi:hypothetical protein
MKPKILLVLVALVAIAGTTVPSNAGGTRARTTVTIRVEGTDFSGLVKSPRPRRCADGRTVRLLEQQGGQQQPGSDDLVASDTASRNGDRYEWSTGNTGGMDGRFYAHVRRTDRCKSDTSRTLEID